MPLTIACSSCGAQLGVPTNAAGQTFKCPKCEKTFRVTGISRQPATPPVAKVEPSSTLRAPPSTFAAAPQPQPQPQPARDKQTKACPFCAETILAVAQKCKHCGEKINVDASASGQPSSLRMLVGWSIAGAMLLGIGLTIGLLVYFVGKSPEQAGNKAVAAGSRAERDESSRLLGDSQSKHTVPEHPQSERGESSRLLGDPKSNGPVPERPQPKRDEPSRLLGDQKSKHTVPERPPSVVGDAGPSGPANQKKHGGQGRKRDREETDAPKDNTPREVTKTLASMDRLTIALPPVTPDDAPTPEVWDGHKASIRGVAYTDDGQFVVSVSGAIEKVGAKADNSIRVWDARRGKQLRKLDDFREALDAVSVSPGGRFAVFGFGGHYEGGKFVNSVDHDVRLWDIQENKQFYFKKGGGDEEQSEARFRGLDSSVFSTAFSPDRKKVVGVSNNGMVVVWDSQTGTSLKGGEIKAIPRPRLDEGKAAWTLRGTTCIRFTPDGRQLMTAGGDYTVRLFDVTSGQNLHIFDNHQDIVWAVATMRTKDGGFLGLSGGGSRQRVRESGFVPGARDYAIRLWDLASRNEIRRFIGHEGSVQSLVFCPNNRHFLSASTDKTVRLWDIAGGKLLRTYRGHTDLIRSVAVSPDGRAAVSGGDDCKLRYWRLPATVEDVILALDKNSRPDLAAAMRDLDTMGPELRDAFAKLAQTLCQSDKAMGSLAMTILERLGKPDKGWANGLRQLLTASLPEARLFAAKALVHLGTDALPALAELRKALGDEDPAVRRNVVAALANIGKNAHEADDELSQLIKREKDEEIKIEAVRALGKIGGKYKLKALFRDVKEPSFLVAVLDALSDSEGLDRSLVEQLLTRKGLQHADAAVRSKALESLRRVGLDTLPITTLAELKLEDASAQVRDTAAKVLGERIEHLSGADIKDVRSLLDSAEKPEAVQIGLEAVRHLGPRAKEVLPELLKRFSAATGKHKLEMCLALAAIDAKNSKVSQAVRPVLVAALRPETADEKPNGAVLKAIASIGEPIVEEIFTALEKADDRGAINSLNRKALFMALQRLGRAAYSEVNAKLLRQYWTKERYRDVQEEAWKAFKAMLPP